MAEKRQEIRIQLGRLRNIHLFSEASAIKRKDEYLPYSNSEVVKKMFGDKIPEIIGTINDSNFMLENTEVENNGVFVEFSYLQENALFKIADSYTGLLFIINELIKIWRGHEEEYSLEKTAENIQQSNVILQKIQRINPDSNIFFWNYFAFRELNINMPM